MSVQLKHESVLRPASRWIRRRGRAKVSVTLAMTIALAAGVVSATMMAPAAAAASRTSADEIAQLNRRATDEYESLNFDKARETLTAALAACEHAGLTHHQVAAEAHLLMGVVLLAGGDKQSADAAAEFRRAIEIRPSIAIPERLANPEIQKAFAEATSRASTAAARPPAARPAEDRDGDESTEPDSKAVPETTAHASADSDSDSDADESDDDDGETARSWFLGFGAGSGLGWTSGTGEVTDARVQSGFHAAAVAHVLPEIGYFIRPDLLLSAQLRVQFVSGASSQLDPSMTICGSDHVCSASKGAMAAFAKATWYLGEGRTFRPYLAGMLGFGQIRHLASVPGAATCGTDASHPVACTDTVAAGPIFLGPGGGLMVNVAPHFALTVGASTFVAIPRFTVHLDLVAGIAVEL